MSESDSPTACVSCGKIHQIQEIELTYGLPDCIFELTLEVRSQRAKISPEICALDESRIFLRGVIPLPVTGRVCAYNIGAWVEISSADLKTVLDLWNVETQPSQVPLKGILANEIYGCPG